MTSITFHVQERPVLHMRGQTQLDIVRCDGVVVRSALSPGWADIECDLLNRCVAEDWDAETFQARQTEALRKWQLS